MSQTHTITYRIRSNQSHREPPRPFTIHVAPEQITELVENGYIVRSNLFTGEHLQALRDIADAVEARALRTQTPGENRGFSGLFVRNIVDDVPLLETLLMEHPELLSVAHAVLGPQVQLHASVLRVAYPDLENQGVEWHFHQRVVPDPEPPFFLRPVVLDNLIYLDDLTPESGPLVVLPGSHKTNEYLPSGDFADKPGQVVVTCPAGSVVTSHSSLWHKALAPQPTGGKRRLLIIGYSAIWLKQVDVPMRLRARVMAEAGISQARRDLCGLTDRY